MKKIEAKQCCKQARFHKLLDVESVKDQMLVSYQQDFQLLKHFFSNFDPDYVEYLKDIYSTSFDAIYNTQEILKIVQSRLKHGEKTLKQSIRKNLIQLLQLEQPVPALVFFLKITPTSFEIHYKEDLLLILDTMLQKFNFDLRSEIYKSLYDALIETTDEEIILLSIKLLNSKFDFTNQFNQKQFDILDQIHSQISLINLQESKDIIIQLVRHFKEFHEKLKYKRESLDQVKSEKFPQFVLKVVLMLLKEQEIVIPELLTFLFFKDTPDKKKCIAIKSQVKEIQKMFEIPRMKTCLNLLKIDDSIFSKGAIGYEQVYSICQKEYPIFLSLKLNGALIQYIEFLHSMTHVNTDQFIQVFHNTAFEDFLTSIWNICGKEIQQLLQNILIEDLEYAKYGSNILRIGTFLYRIKFKLEKKIINNIERGGDLEEQSIERRADSMNPLFKTFITYLVSKQIPFPLLLKTLKMDYYNLKIGYRITDMRELVVDPKFKSYMKQYHGVICNKQDPDENLDHIITRQYPIKANNNGKKYELNWPRLIKKQVKLIFENRELVQQQLIEIHQNQNFMKVYNELIKINDNNKKKMQTKEILIELVAYIKSIQNQQ
ncbi:unnamed protein product (macronuclear) [Paramecium tetraurelia]|uniref:Uncharacterized protein n=2 Tax=Paramecium tetraurelia TaxID=5888 RepID=A0C6Z8_PARTE|nr:uncharacterized protein GSPATT00035694001 [Paramecium tetraurelia]CAK66565.1 unnamed protein product [Paramecium tetraurelia]|eukprot:XP_001433962.1 hypothetical protein (macronuclear) [Paramecium tetraurelia strain d4-2]